MLRNILRITRGTAALLAVTMLFGCASRRVYFTSWPPGAEVTVGSRIGYTPCEIKVPEGAETATFFLPDTGEEQTVPLPEMDGNVDKAAEVGRMALGGSCMVVGAGVGVLGLLVFIAGTPDTDDDEVYSPYDDDEDEWDGSLVAAGLGGMAAGGAVFMLGKWIYPEREVTTLNVDFQIDDE